MPATLRPSLEYRISPGERKASRTRHAKNSTAHGTSPGYERTSSTRANGCGSQHLRNSKRRDSHTPKTHKRPGHQRPVSTRRRYLPLTRTLAPGSMTCERPGETVCTDNAPTCPRHALLPSCSVLPWCPAGTDLQGLRSLRRPRGTLGVLTSTTKEAVSEVYVGRQIVGMDLHRRRSVLVRILRQASTWRRCGSRMIRSICVR
jgi:hypothetical protein